MTRRARQVLLTLYAAGAIVLLAVAIRNPQLFRDARPPADAEGKARWLADHPADWIAASELSDAALDLQSPQRFRLWYAAYAHARRLAPHRKNTALAFVRGGLFHWYELGEEHRRRVLDAAGPLLRDPAFFARMHAPLWQLTRNFGWLRRHAPDTIDARTSLRDLAIVRGLFPEYRVLREEIRRERLEALTARRNEEDPSKLLDLVPPRLDTADVPLVRAILEEFERKHFDPLQVSGAIEPVVDFAVRHKLQPLSGLQPLLDSEGKLANVTRARAALAAGNAPMATRIEMTTGVAGSREWNEYFLDRARFEAQRGNTARAEAYLLRVALAGKTLPVVATAEEVAKIAGNERDAARHRAELEALGRQRSWSGTCSGNELCNTVTATEYVRGKTIRIELATTQSDETPPYVEIYVDDTLTAEGEVPDASTFEVPAAPGLHRLEVRLVNPRTRNGVQRRVRLS